MFVALAATCGLSVARRPGRRRSGGCPCAGRTPIQAARPGHGQVLTWAALAFLPSALLLGVTAYISTDVAAVPLLWVVPLAMYLATFVVAFGRRRDPTAARRARVAVAAAFAVAVSSLGSSNRRWPSRSGWTS